MKNQLHTAPDEHLEARITAWVLGEASPFEAAELEALCAEDPALQVFVNRTRALHSLLLETPPSSSDQFWKLSPERRAKLDPIIGPSTATHSNKNSSVRRAAYRTFFGIAAVLTATLFIKRFIFTPLSNEKTAMTIVGGSEFKMELSERQLPQIRGMILDEAPEDIVAEKKSFRSISSSASKKPSAPSASTPAPTVENSTAMADGDKGYRFSGQTELFSRAKDTSSRERSGSNEEKSINNPDPAKPSMAKVIAANNRPGVNIPVPDVDTTSPSMDYGDGKDFGGWGGGQGNAGLGKNDGGIGYMRLEGEGGGGANRDMSNTALATESLAATDDAFASNDSRQKGGFTYEAEKFKNETESATVPGIPGETATSTGSGTTAGLRSGDYAIQRESVDAILNNPDRTVAANKEAERGPEDQAPVNGISFSHKGLAQREIARRQNNITEADRNLVEGREAYAKGDYSQAADKYKEALGSVRDIPALTDRQESYSQHLADASVAQAQQMRKVGKYDEARKLLEQAETLSPSDATIKNELGYLNDPIRTSPALTYEHVQKVDEVRRNLYKAQGNYDLGKYDDAKKAYEDALRIDPYNSAARRGMEKVAATESDYYRAAYDQTRTELLMEVDKAWELSVPAEGVLKKAEEIANSDYYRAAYDATRSNLSKPTDDATKFNLSADSFAAATESGSTADPFAAPAESGPTDDPFAAPTSGKGKELADSNFDGFINFGAPIAGGQSENEPKSVKIQTKFVEITQEDQDELGFDWVLKSGLNSPAQNGKLVTPAFPTEFETLNTGEEVEGEKIPILGDIPVVGRLFKPKPPSLTDLSNEISASEEVFSTFSLNISDASFQIARAALERGERPDPTSIKPEQFYNAVDYGDPAPSASEPVAAAIDQAAHPVIPGRNLVRVALRTASTGRSEAQPLRLTLLVDQSGSMVRGDRRVAMETALTQLATLLTENDQITVIGFSRTPHLLVESLPGNEAAKLPEIINQTASEGGTNLEQAINLATDLATRHQLEGAQNRIVLFTDGAANLGDANPERLSDKIENLRQQGLAFDIAGIGTNDLNDRLLSDLARHGNGRYYLVGEKTGGNFAAQLAGAFRPAAENVKVQVKLNPQRVGNYKLIGFEKDRLKTEDFHNDAVDAAELAADEAGVALYQVETLPQGTGEIGQVSVRFRDTASGEMVERKWTIPYDASTPSFDKANPKTQLATLAVLAAQKLQTGPLADAIDFSNYSKTIAELKQANANSDKIQQLLNLINGLK